MTVDLNLLRGNLASEQVIRYDKLLQLLIQGIRDASDLYYSLWSRLKE